MLIHMFETFIQPKTQTHDILVMINSLIMTLTGTKDYDKFCVMGNGKI